MSKTWGFSLPQANEVVVYRLSLTLPAQDLAFCQSVLSEEELQRAERFIGQIKRLRYIACWGQVRWLLGLSLNQAPKTLEFIRNPWGKPYLPKFGLAFNLSHTEDWLLIALAWGRELGIDVEMIRPLAEMERLAKRCLAPLEWETWCQLGDEPRVLAFFRFWTLKEALMKASGYGLRLGMANCVFSLETGLLKAPKPCEPVASWQIHEWIEEKFCAALCARPRGFAVVERCLTPGWISAASSYGRDQK